MELLHATREEPPALTFVGYNLPDKGIMNEISQIGSGKPAFDLPGQNIEPGVAGSSRHLVSSIPPDFGNFNEREQQLALKRASKIESSIAYRHYLANIDKHPNVSVDPWINGGRPTIEGTGIRVSTVVGYLSTNSIRRLLNEVPMLNEEKVRDAMLYACDLLEG